MNKAGQLVLFSQAGVLVEVAKSFRIARIDVTGGEKREQITSQRLKEQIYNAQAFKEI
jgi:hypothetical protein